MGTQIGREGMTEEDDLADPNAREEKTQDKKGDVRLAGRLPSKKDEIIRKIEEEACIQEEVNDTIEELRDREKDEAVKVTIMMVISLILVCIMIVGILITNEGVFYLFGFLIFLIFIISVSSIIARLKGKRSFINEFSLSEKYRFYLDKIIELLPEYNKKRKKERKEYYVKKMKYRVIELYQLSIYWKLFLKESNKPALYIDLFTNNLDEFNSKLRILLLRLNGFIKNLENVPEEIIKELERLLNYLNDNSTKFTTGHLNCLRHSIDYLEKNYPIVWEEVIREPFIPRVMRKFWGKTAKWFKATFLWSGTAAIYWVLVTWIDFNITNDTKFLVFATLWGAWLYVLYLIFKER